MKTIETKSNSTKLIKLLTFYNKITGKVIKNNLLYNSYPEQFNSFIDILSKIFIFFLF